jgi:type I restriction enzyme R subunit
MTLNKKLLSERDICTKFITPAVVKAGWNVQTQILEEVTFTDGRIYVRGNLTTRGKGKRADYILYYKPNIPIAIIEAKDNNHTVRSGLQQALEYARILDIPSVFSSNGDGFLWHDRTASQKEGLNLVEQEIPLDSFPSPSILWERYKAYKGIAEPNVERIAVQDYYFDGSGRMPRYYQQIAINRTVEAIAKGQQRILLVMATGTGKTYTAFQIIYRLWKSGTKKRILFLADRTALIDQTRRGDFRHFKDKMTVIKHREIDTSYEIYLALYQGLSGSEAEDNAYREFSPEFFDLIIIDECHRGSAKEDSAWREILTYFHKATHIGLTATPKETEETSNIEYFGEPLYTYSLRQGIDDGFLAPYRVVRVGLNVDLEGWRPDQNKRDKHGNPVEDRVYNRLDYDKSLVIDERTHTVAAKVSEFLKGTDRFSKTIAFCSDIDHAERMRSALVNCNADLATENPKYVMQITGDNDEGKRELDNFISPEERYPTLVTTSKLLTTGVDAQTCKVIVLDSNIQSMTEFKQIIGRGTRINEEFGKLYFTILDFRNVTDLFADPHFDGEPVRIKVLGEHDDIGAVEEEELLDDSPLTDSESGEAVVFPEPEQGGILPEPPPLRGPEELPEGGGGKERRKVYVNGVDVSVLVERELQFDNDGKPITVSLKDFTRTALLKRYASLDAFLTHWNTTERKRAVLNELQEQNVPIDALMASADHEADIFDFICYVAFDQPPMTRRERANNVKKRDVFAKFGAEARAVLDALLDKYADSGVEALESLDVLKVQPLSNFGSPMDIVKRFGGKDGYLQAVRALEAEIYGTAA